MRKTISILFALALVLSFSLVATTPVAAVTAVLPGVGTIQAAVAASSANDILQLTAGGMYIESQITIPHNLTIIGGSPKAVINPAGNLIGTGSAQAWILVNPGVTFTLRDVELNGGSLFVTQAIRNHGFTTVDSVDFRNIQSSTSGSPYTGMGIVSFGGIVPGGMGSDTHGGGGGAASTLVVTGSSFAQIGRIGVLVKGTQSTALVGGCTYTGRGSGDWLDYGVEVGAGGTATITGNTFTKCGTSSTAWASAGILVTDAYGPGSAATITCNILTNNQYGIASGYNAADASVVTAHFNSFSGNTYGIRSPSTVANTDGRDNWWGDDSGPSGGLPDPVTGTPASGTGDPVSANVLFDPWIKKTVATTATGTGPVLFSPSVGNILDLTPVAAPSLPSVTFPHGMFSFQICCLTPGQTVDVTVTLPSAVPVGTVWWKYHNGQWSSLPNLSDNGDNIMVIRLKDGGVGDSDGVADGFITDPGGPGNPMTVGWDGSPTSKAAVMIPIIGLLAAIAGVGMLVWRRRRAEG